MLSDMVTMQMVKAVHKTEVGVGNMCVIVVL